MYLIMNKKQKRTLEILSLASGREITIDTIKNISKQINTTQPCVVRTLLSNGYKIFFNLI